MTTLNAEQEATFDSWAIVDVMGHQRFIGRVTEQVIAGQGFIRVDVPDVESEDPGAISFTKVLGAKSIYMIEPVSKDTALAMCKRGKQLSIGQRFEQRQQPRLIDHEDIHDEMEWDDDNDDSDEPY